MLNIHRMATTSFRTWGRDITEPESKTTSPTNLTPEQTSQEANSWMDIDGEPTTTPVSEHSYTTSACSDDLECTLPANLRYNTPTTDSTLSSTIPATDSHTLDTVAFPSYATHLLPSEPNGTWRTQVSYALQRPSESASTFRKALEQHAPELDVPSLLRQLEEVAEDRKGHFNDSLNQMLADYDLVEMHNRVRHLVPVISMPNMRQIDCVVDTVIEVAQSLRKRRSESEPFGHQYDKYAFTRIMCEHARRALVEQGICKDWQFLSVGHAKLQHVMQSALIHTFIHIQQSYKGVPLFCAKPQWLADRKNKVWRLELDVGRVGVEVGPITDISLVELGFIDTGFELPESCGCVSITDFDRQIQVVEGDWQLLET